MASLNLLQKIFPKNSFGCCQSKRWMGKPCRRLWVEHVWIAYKQNYKNELLLLDEFTCHEQHRFINIVNKMGTHMEIIPGEYNRVLHPCDVGTVKFSMGGIWENGTRWVSERLFSISACQAIFIHERNQICLWVIVIL